MKNIFFIFFLTTLCISISQAQITPENAPQYAEVKANDGNKYVGKVLERDEDKIVIETISAGEITIESENIKSIKFIAPGQIKNGQYWPENPNSVLYFLGNSGFGLRKGEGFYQNSLLFYNGIGYGFSDNFSLNIGGNPFFDGAQFLLINPKFSVPLSQKFNLGVGTTFFIADGGYVGFLYGAGTVGSRNNNATFGLGYGFGEDGFLDLPVFSFSGIARIAKNLAIVTENWFIPIDNDESFYTVSLGLRYLTSNVSVDIAIVVPDGADTPLPFVGVIIPFGNR